MKRLDLPPLEDKFRTVIPRAMSLRGVGEEDSSSFTLALNARSFDELFKVPGSVFSSIAGMDRTWSLKELEATLISELKSKLPWEFQESRKVKAYYRIVLSYEVIPQTLKNLHERLLRKLRKAKLHKPVYLRFLYAGAEGLDFRVGLLRELRAEQMLLLTEKGYRTFDLSKTYIQEISNSPYNGFRELVFSLTATGNLVEVTVELKDLS